MSAIDNSMVDENVLQNLLSFLDQKQVKMIDDALASLGEYGVLRLVVEKGRLRFLVTQKSYDAHKWRLQNLDEESLA